MKQIALRLPDDMADAIDTARQDVPRERWIRRVIEREIARADSNRRAVEAALPGHEGAGDREAVEGRGVRQASAEPNRAPSPPVASPRAPDDVRRREPDPRMFKTAGDHRRAMARFNARGEW